jgi:hypothetical protein
MVVRRWFRPLILALPLFGLQYGSTAEKRVEAIWAVNDGEKVEKDDLANSSKRSNSVWDGRKIRLFAARNEVIAFQVVVEAGSTAYRFHCRG